jgi:hypothetical protein
MMAGLRGACPYPHLHPTKQSFAGAPLPPPEGEWVNHFNSLVFRERFAFNSLPLRGRVGVGALPGQSAKK